MIIQGDRIKIENMLYFPYFILHFACGMFIIINTRGTLISAGERELRKELGGLNVDIAKKLREIRILRNLTQHQVATLTGIGYKTINNYENGASKPDIDKLSKLCQIYDVSADYFLDAAYNDQNEYNFYLTLKEQQHIKKYRSLDKQSRKVIDILMEVELRRGSNSTVEVKKNQISFQETDKEIKFYLNSDSEDEPL